MKFAITCMLVTLLGAKTSPLSGPGCSLSMTPPMSGPCKPSTGTTRTHSTEEAAASLIKSESCTIVEEGESLTPLLDAGSCFELHVGRGPDSRFIIATEGISGLVVFTQHVPIEFERDQHYLQDSAGTDIEPIVQEGGGGHGHGHDHDDDPSGATANAASGAVAALLGSILMVLL